MSKNCCEFDNEDNCIISDDVFIMNITETNDTLVNEMIYDTFIFYLEELKYTVVKTEISIFQFSTIDEQLNKKRKLEKQINKIKSKSPSVLFSKSPNLFSLQAIHDLKDIKDYGMTNYEDQQEQAERDVTISNEREKKNTENKEMYGGWKYSNVAILRSLVKKKEKPLSDKDNPDKNYINYNLYIEGSGQQWDTDSDLVGLGMGTGRTGVVGLVSKAVVFVGTFLHSHIEKGLRESVNIHFAVFGFSRGSTCGRVFWQHVERGGGSISRKRVCTIYACKRKVL